MTTQKTSDKSAGRKKKNASKKAKTKKPAGSLKGLIITGSVIAALAVAACVTYVYFGKAHEGDDVWLKISAGASESEVRDEVTSVLGADESGRVLTIWNMLHSDPGKAHGAYLVKKGQPAWRTAFNLSRGRQTPVRITWNNVRLFSQIAERVSDGLDFTAADFEAAADTVLPSEGYSKAQFPAAFLPDSYEFYWGARPEKVIRTMLQSRNKFWNDERIKKAESLGLTPTEVATLASIVEEETAKTDEMPKVARLYLNRLKQGMPLQADPTVKFAIGDFSIKRISTAMLQTPSPYNTYKNKGLPPGPIRVASQTGIDAVLDAPKHDYIYMCAKEDFSGYHNFSKSYSEHQANAARYQAELNRRNIH